MISRNVLQKVGSMGKLEVADAALQLRPFRPQLPDSRLQSSHQFHLFCSSRRRQHQRRQSHQSLSHLPCTQIWGWFWAKFGEEAGSSETWPTKRKPDLCGLCVGTFLGFTSSSYSRLAPLSLHHPRSGLSQAKGDVLTEYLHLHQSSDDMRPDTQREFGSTHWAPEFFCQMGAPAGQSPTELVMPSIGSRASAIHLAT